MKWLKTVLFFPLALIRLFLVLFATAAISFAGLIKLWMFGFSRNLQHWVLLSWGKTILFICGVKLNRNTLPGNDNFILMPNHRSYLDIFIVASLKPSSFVGKSELRNWPFGKTAVKISNLILVDRKDTRSLLTTMGKIKSCVEQGIPVTLFPEGTTFKGPLTKHFKNGSFKIASDMQIPVIPVAIEYRDENDAWVGKDTFVVHFFRQMGKPLTHVTIRFGEPVLDTDYQQLQQKVKNKIDSLLKEINSQ